MSQLARPTTVLVVDDEPHERAGLARIIAAHPEFEQVGECCDGESAVRAIRRLTPDLVLLDVQMPPPDGFGVLRAIGPDRMPAVVFVTAHDSYAIAAFEAHAVDYVLKPFRESRLLEAMRRARTQIEEHRLGDMAKRLLAIVSATAPLENDVPSRIVVRSIGRTDVVLVSDLIRIEGAGYCVTLHTAKGAVVHRESLDSLEQRLPRRDFVRVHRSTIVNVNRIVKLKNLGNSRRELLLSNGSRVHVSKARWSAVADVLRRWAGDDDARIVVD